MSFTPDETDTGHLPALARPKELAERLLDYEVEQPPTPDGSRRDL